MPFANLRPEQPNTTIWSCPSARSRRLVFVIAAVFASAGSLSAAINSPTNAIGTVGLPFSYQISTTETATNYGASGLPIGIVAPGSNGLITGLPQSAGTYTSTVTAAQTNGSVSNKVVIKINPPAPPELVSPLTFFGMQGELLRYPLLSVPSHSNVPTTFVVSGPPSGSSLTSNVTTNTAYTNVLVTNYFIDSASLAASGSFVVPVVTRNQGGTNTNNVTFVISPKTNPVITSASNASAIVGVPFTFDVTAINSPRGFRVASVALGTNTNATANVTNGVLTNGLSFSNVTNGSYVIGRIFGTPAIATNVTLGLQATNSTLPAALQTLTINVGSPQPTVILTQPLGEANYVLGSSFFLNAQAFDRVPDTIVPSSVGFTAGGLPVSGTVTRLGEYYGVEFYPANPAAFPVVASAQNSLGQTVTSSPLPMTPATPQSAFPSVSMLPLFPGPQIQAGGTVTLRARAFSPQTAIQRVEFYVNKVFVGATTATAATNEYQLPWETPVTPGNFEIHARVVSVNIAAGGLGPGTPPYYASTITRAPVVLNTVSGVLPSVAIVSPTDGAQLPFNVATRVVASANVFGGSIQQVQFYRDGQPLGAADTTAPYSVDFIPNSYGSYQLFAIATTSAGLINISPTVTVTVPELVGADPTVTLSAPSAAKTGELLTLAADASDADGNIVSVQFLANGVPLPTPDAAANPNPDLAAPYRYAFAPSAPGRYELIARATDNSGNVTDSEVRVLTVSVGTPPTASITSPSASPHAMKINETVEIRADASAAAGRNIARVEFLLNGRAPLPTSALTPSVLTAGPYRFTWRADNTGQYALVVRVTDNLGNITDSTPITINVTQGTAPTVAISTPLSTDTLTPGVPATIVAVPEGKSGSVTQVEFFVNGVSVGVSAPPNAPPYVASFTPSAVGPYTLMARVTDSLGNVADSATRTVNAAAPSGAQPLISLTQPAGVSNMVVGSELYLNATATNADGSVLSGAGAGVTFYVNGLPVAGTADLLKPSSYSAKFTVGSSALYVIQAVATNSAGNKAASGQSTINVRARANDLPQVQVLELLPGASTVAGGNIALRAQALFPAAAAGNARVQFYGNGVLLGESAAPVGSIYTFNWTVPTNLAGENITITARALAENTAGNALTAPFFGSTISANTPTVVNLGTGPVPVVSITAPSGTIPLGVPTNINVSATVTGGTVGAVDFYVNGTLIGTDATAPFSLPWTPTSTGTYTLGAIATSNAGIAKAASSTVSVTSGNAPTISLTAPSAATTNVTVGRNVTFAATAADSDGSIAQVEFLVNGLVVNTDAAAPYRFAYPVANAGRYEVAARATDNLGNVTQTAAKVLNASSGTPPTVTLASPLAGATLTPGIPISIIADVEGKSGTVTQVEFFVNDVSVGSAAAEPYLAAFTPPAAGPYEIFARVTDSLGNVVDSAKRTVTAVKPAGLQPLVLLSQPLANSRFVAGSTIYLNATATKANGSIDPGMALKFLVNGIEQSGVAVDKATGQFSVPFVVAQAGTTYSVQAVATQTGGVQGAAAPVSVATLGAQNPLPQVEILELLPGTATTAGGVVPLRAEARLFGADPAQTAVQFYADGVYLGDGTLQTDGTYLFNWKTPSAVRAYAAIRARVVAPNATLTTGGGGGQQQQTTVYFASVFSSNFITINTAAGVPPVVNIVQPADGFTATLGQPLTLRASAGGSPGVASIRITNGGGGYISAPAVTVAAPPAGGTQAKAVAVLGSGTNAGKVVRVDVTDAGSGYTVRPSVTFAAAPAGGTRATGTAFMRTPNIASVQFLLNGEPIANSTDTSAPYETVITPQSQGSYVLSAIARSTDGLVSVADSVVVTVTSGLAPNVNITNPTVAAGTPANYVPGTTVPVAASAQPVTAGARIASMQFFVNGVSLGLPDTQAPYEQPFTIPGAGPYSIVAVATDSFGNTGSSTVRINSAIPAGGAPFVQINYPTPNPIFLLPGSEIFVNAEAVVPAGRSVKEIRFYLDGTRVKTATSAPQASYLYRQADSLGHVIVAEVVDSANNAFYSVPLQIFPQASFNFPAPTIDLQPIQGSAGGTTVGSSVFLVAESNAGLNAVQVIDFYANGDFIGSVRNNNDPGTGRFRAVFEWQPPSAGNFDLRAAARGVGGVFNATFIDNYVVLSAPRTLKVSAATAAPAVSFLSPANNTTFAPNTQVVVTAQATAATGRRITRVDFYVNGEPVLEDTSAPFSLPLTLPTPGGYLVTAVATDSSNRSSSAQITLNAKAPTGGEPVVAVTQPLGESRFVFGSELFLNMTASDRGGSIKAGSTQFYLNGEARAAAFAFNNAYAATYVSSTTTPVLEISAVAEDNSGNVTVSRGPRLDFVQATRPLPLGVEVLPLPANTSTPVGGLIPLRATAIFPANAGEEKRVDFFVDGVYVGTGAETAAGSNIYTYSWRAPSQPATGKSYEVQARALALNTTVTTGQDNKEEVKYYSSVVSSNPTPFIVTTGTAIPPVARVTSPLGGTTIPVGKEVSILADASATGSTIARVEFFVNGRSVGSSTQAPYSIKFTPPSKGVYNLAAVAETASGLQAPSPTVSVTVVEAGPSQVPAVTILSPRSGQTFVPGSSVTVRSEALSPSFFPIESVTFYVNDVLAGTSTSASSSGEYSQVVNLPSQGNYFLKVVASDIYGNTGFAESVIISRIGSGPAPVVNFTVPAQDTDYVMDSEIYLNATATDSDGPVTSVKFFANNAEIKGSSVKRLGNTYSVRWKIPAADQSFVLHATATDGRGNSTSSDPVTIVTAPRINPLPALTLLSPVAPTAPGEAMTLRARATFPPEAATGAAVQFYADGALVGTGQKSSGDIYTLAWTPPTGATLDDLGAVASAVNYATGRTFLGAKLAQNAVGKDKPVINSPSTWTAAVGLAKTYRITATNGPLVSFTARQESGAALPSWMTLDAATGIITATPPRATTTPLKIRVTATNLGGVTSDPFIITFTAIPAPAITSSSTWEMTVGKVNTYQILTSVPATSYALIGAKPSWMTSFNTSTGLITANPTAAIADTVLQLTAANAAGNGPVFNLAVRTPVPRITAPTSVIAPPGVTTSVQMQASGAPTSWSKKSGPAWVTISAAGLLSVLPPAGGTFTAVITASNAYGPSPDFTVTIDATTPPGSAVATFNTAAGANASVLSVAPDLSSPDSLFYIGGSFTQYAGQAAGRLARLKADGTQDATFAPGTGPNAAVTALAVQPSDKRLLVGGEFTRFNGAVAGRLVRMLRTGAVDSAFVTGTGANAPIRAIAVQKDGRILVAGEFTTFNGQPAPYIARLTANGSVDPTFKPGLGPNNRVNAIALANDGKIYIGGWFAAFDGRDAGRIARLNADGSFDVSFDTRGGVSNTAASAATDPFNPGIGTTGTVNALAVLTSGRLVVGGDFNTAAGDVPSYRLAAFDPNGLVVREFSFNAPCDKPVDTLVAESDGRVVGGGAFSLVGNPVQNRAGIARFSAVGAVEASFRSPFPAAVTSVVSALAVQPNGNILAGGNFRSVQGATQVRIAMLYGKDATTASSKLAPATISGQVGQRLVHRIDAAGTPTYRLAAGSTLPAGLALRATTGVLAGTPTTAGTYRFTVETVSGGSVLPLAFTVVIKP